MTSPTHGGAGRAAAAQTSDQPQQTFSESLFAASAASSEDGSAEGDSPRSTRRQRSASEDAQTHSAVSDGGAVQAQVLPQQTVAQQQVLLAQGADQNASSQVLRDGSAAASSDVVASQPICGVAAAKLAGTVANIAQPDGASSNADKPGNDSSQTASSLLGAGISGLKELGKPLSKAGNLSSHADGSADTNPDRVQNSLPEDVANTDGTTVPSDASNSASSSAVNFLPSAIPNAVLNVSPQAIPNTDSAPIGSAALNTSAPEVADPTSSTAAIDQTMQSPSIANESTGATSRGASGVIANQFVTLAQQNSAWAGAARASVASLNPATAAKTPVTSGTSSKNGSKDATDDTTGSKQQAQFAVDQAPSKTSGTTLSGDQHQSGASAQGQSQVPAQMNLASHPAAAIVQTQSTASAAPEPSAFLSGGNAARDAKVSDSAASASVAVSQATPVIQTAKLIQSMDQSEMRVGMRSNEFGNISISTSATRDLISTQISLDHSELAKTLAANLPELQANRGSNLAMDVHIVMNDTGAGLGTGTSGGMSDGAAEQWHGGRQQPGNAASNYAGDRVTERPLSAVATATGYGGLSARLDIRV